MGLPKVAPRELEVRARASGVSVEEYLLDLLLKDADPASGAEKYLEGAEELLAQAKEELSKGDLRQASEKVWGACALAIKAHALHREGRKLESHRELWEYKNEVAKELGDWVRAVFRQANTMHTNFYENQATKEDIKDVIKEVSKLVSKIKETLKHRAPH